MVGELGVLKIGQLGMGEIGDGCVDAFDGDITSSVDVDVGGAWECKERPCDKRPRRNRSIRCCAASSVPRLFMIFTSCMSRPRTLVFSALLGSV